ncbi:MAG: hypothetical protein ACK5DG_08320 [Chitinophagaceae bacterium]|jgi:hypothetical protein
MTSSKSSYKFDIERVVGLCLLPFFFGCLSILILYSKLTDYEDPITVIDVLAYFLFFIFTTGVFIFLFFRYFSSEKNKVLTVTDDVVTIDDKSKTISIKLKEIESINEFHAGRLPWGHLRKWEFVTANEKFIVSSLTISWLNFHRHFGDKIQYHFVFLA